MYNLNAENIIEKLPMIITIIMLSLYNTYPKKLPDFIKYIVRNPFIRTIFLMLLLVYRIDKNPFIALSISIFFLLTINKFNNEENEEKINK